MQHTLKIHPEPYAAVVHGDKTFEFRKDDRIPRFEVGDQLVLEEYQPDLGAHTGKFTKRRVTYILRGPAFGVPEGYCVMSIT